MATNIRRLVAAPPTPCGSTIVSQVRACKNQRALTRFMQRPIDDEDKVKVDEVSVP